MKIPGDDDAMYHKYISLTLRNYYKWNVNPNSILINRPSTKICTHTNFILLQGVSLINYHITMDFHNYYNDLFLQLLQ